MKKIVFALLVLALVLAGCTQPTTPPITPNPDANLNFPPGGPDMTNTVENTDTVQVNYRGTLADGTEFDSSLKPGRTPLEFEVGAGQMIKGFDKAVVGMKLNEEKTVILSPSDAYGETDPSLIIDFTKERFGEGFDQVTVGMKIQADNGQRGIVTAKTATSATVNFNHELAGKPLTFWIKIVTIQKSG